MKAIHITSFTANPSLLKPSIIPRPTPQPDQYLVRVTHCSPQHADILHAQGRHQNNNAKKGWCFPPFVLGYDFAGIIESTPSPGTISSPPSSPTTQDNHNSNPTPAESQFQRGDRVFGASIGSFAEFIAVPAAAIHLVPSSLSLSSACAISGQAVSYAAIVHVARVQPGETVLVSGASGGLGSAACMIARAVGARVIALTGDAGKVAAMRKGLGIEDVLVVEESKAWLEAVKGLTGGQGVDVVIDNTGMVNDAIRAAAYGARIVVLGFAARNGVMESVKMNLVLLKGLAIMGYRFGEGGRRFPEELREIWKGFLEMLEEGRLRPLVFEEYRGLESIGRALGDLAARRVSGKIVVTVADDSSVARL